MLFVENCEVIAKCHLQQGKYNLKIKYFNKIYSVNIYGVYAYIWCKYMIFVNSNVFIEGFCNVL